MRALVRLETLQRTSLSLVGRGSVAWRGVLRAAGLAAGCAWLLAAVPIAHGDPAVDGVWHEQARPSARYGASAVYDSLRDRMVMFGGFSDARMW